jgi:hypothetical protein
MIYLKYPILKLCSKVYSRPTLAQKFWKPVETTCRSFKMYVEDTFLLIKIYASKNDRTLHIRFFLPSKMKWTIHFQRKVLEYLN